jgi:hypothetical protein
MRKISHCSPFLICLEKKKKKKTNSLPFSSTLKNNNKKLGWEEIMFHFSICLIFLFAKGDLVAWVGWLANRIRIKRSRERNLM